MLGSMSPVLAQAPLPADCPSRPVGGGMAGNVQVVVPFGANSGAASASGAAAGKSGYAKLDIPLTMGGTTCQAAQPVLPEDVLHGTPDPDLLRGFGPHDVLHDRDPPAEDSGASVFIDVR
jgi:hypothetical protein